MNKAVLISIQPQWCELIASGEKTVEVRKTKPKLQTPFRCYIYETQGRTETPFVDEEGHEIFKGRGQVIGEFVCDRIDTVASIRTPCMDYITVNDKWNTHFCEISCLNVDELGKYLGFNKDGYAWHISDLVIYDEPKELIYFYVWKKCNSCRDTGYESTACCFDIDCKVPAVITRPPQSWCYVEELKGDTTCKT